MRHHIEAESDEIALYRSSIVATLNKHTANLDGNMRRSVCTWRRIEGEVIICIF